MSDANADARARLEQSIRERCEAGDFDRATAAALRGYGPELFGFLVSVLRGPDAAGEAFSLLGEDIWRGLPKFGWVVLRVDRGLAWEELARVMLDDPAATSEALKRESARLRKRFQLVKEKLLELGREAGLVGGDD